MGRLRHIQRSATLGYLASLGAVSVVTALIAVVIGRVPLANVSMLYLIAVLATAVGFGSGPAVLASFAAFLAFDWFFVEPYGTIGVTSPAEWTSLLLFLLTAIVTGQLAGGQRRQARDAREREREAVVLYDVVRLMGDPNLDHALHAVASRLRDELGLAAIAVELPGDANLAPSISPSISIGDPPALETIRARQKVASIALSEGQDPADHRPGRAGAWRQISPPLRGGAEGAGRGTLYQVPIDGPRGRQGGLFLVRAPGEPPLRPGDDRLLSAVAAQLGLALERSQLRREATTAEVLRRTDELRKALLNAVSHDLRTPLASIIAAAGSLSEDDVAWTREDLKAFGHDIEAEALRLNRIVGNLLDLSRIQSGALVPQKGWYDLDALIDDVVGRLRPQAARRRVILDVAADLPPIPLDYVEIDQVLTNLLENALKHGGPEGPIEVEVRAHDAEVEIVVADRGPGIPPAALDRVFEPFYRAAQRPSGRGTGLGLAVARGLVEAHRGRIWAENRPGGGARFVFTLPLVRSAARVAAAEAISG